MSELCEANVRVIALLAIDESVGDTPNALVKILTFESLVNKGYSTKYCPFVSQFAAEQALKHM